MSLKLELNKSLQLFRNYYLISPIKKTNDHYLVLIGLNKIIKLSFYI